MSLNAPRVAVHAPRDGRKEATKNMYYVAKEIRKDDEWIEYEGKYYYNAKDSILDAYDCLSNTDKQKVLGYELRTYYNKEDYEEELKDMEDWNIKSEYYTREDIEAVNNFYSPIFTSKEMLYLQNVIKSDREINKELLQNEIASNKTSDLTPYLQETLEISKRILQKFKPR